MVSALIEGAVLVVLGCPVSEPIADTKRQKNNGDVREFAHGNSPGGFSDKVLSRRIAASRRIHFGSGLL